VQHTYKPCCPAASFNKQHLVNKRGRPFGGWQTTAAVRTPLHQARLSSGRDVRRKRHGPSVPSTSHYLNGGSRRLGMGDARRALAAWQYCNTAALIGRA